MDHQNDYCGKSNLASEQGGGVCNGHPKNPVHVKGSYQR